MSDPPASTIAVADAARAYATLASAYSEDPIYRWAYPESDVYATQFPLLMAAIGDSAFSTGTAWQLEDFAAAVLWVAPGYQPDAERVGAAVLTTVAPDKQDDVFGTLGQTEARHPFTTHYYLTFLGVDPSKQGRRLGSRLLEHCLAYVDSKGAPAMAEVTNARAVALLERHGFVLSSFTETQTMPPLAFMVRPAAATG